MAFRKIVACGAIPKGVIFLISFGKDFELLPGGPPANWGARVERRFRAVLIDAVW